MPEPSDLARQFRLLRRRREMTQADLSRLSGVAKSEISRFECGWASSTARSLEREARVLGARMILRPNERQDHDSEPELSA
jgi:transcriptional regulator with XRE-family HTH domain